MNQTVFIRGGSVIDPASGLHETADLLIHSGRIVEIGRIDPPSGAEEISADGLIVAPGLVDMHVHLREPGYEYKETIAGGCEAAVAGGVTSVAAMPNTRPVVDDVSVVAYLMERAREKGLIHLFPVGAITKGLEGRELTEMGRLKQAGCVAFSDDGRPVVESNVMRRALEYAGALDLLIIQHAEDPALTEGGCMNEGVVSARLGLSGIPSASEEIMVDRDLRLLNLTKGRYHVAHLSTEGALDAVEKAQAHSLRASCEVTPHHLVLLDTSVENGYDTNAKMAPPLRGRADRKALREGLARGVIAAIATDHAPHETESKAVPFCDAANGVIGLETLLPIVLELVSEGVMTLLEGLAKVTCNPARLLGIDRGYLAVGGPADIILLDSDECWTVTSSSLHGTAKNSCFLGRDMRGRVQATFVNGRMVYEKGP